MKVGFWLVLLMMSGSLMLWYWHSQPNSSTIPHATSTSVFMQISSPAFAPNNPIPARYTCDGENISPPLSINGVPSTAESLVLIMDDPDAPAGTWVHWVLWNISARTTKIAENTLPAGAEEGMTSFGKPGYGGPCPPSGTHRYIFHLYAIDTVLRNLPKGADRSQVEKATKLHTVDQADLIGLYSRSK